MEAKQYDPIDLKRIENTSNGVFGFFVNRRKTALLLTLIIVVWGLFALGTLPREANPEVKIPFALVTTVWPGASPIDIEEQVTNEIEKKIKNIEHVKEISSASSESISSISVEFDADADLDLSIRKLRDAVDTVTGLPSDISDNPSVLEISINDQPIVSFSLVGDVPEQDMKKIAEALRDEIESISGVSEAQIVGERAREWRVTLKPSALKQLGLNTAAITRAITQSHLNVPLGDITLNNTRYNVRTKGKLETLEALGNIPIKQTEQHTILLRDIANINDQLVEQKTIARISQGGDTARPALTVQVFKQTGGNIINIVDSARERVRKLTLNGMIPSSVDVVVTNDNSQFIRDDFRTLSRSGIQTLLLIFVSLAVVLAFRMAIIAVVSIPIIFLMSFGIVDIQGSTLNSLTLFSLVLSLGLLIDTTIVLLEGIYDGLRKGYSTHEAALYSIATYKWPIIAGVLTTIAAFVPMLLVEGIVGEFLKYLPLTISAVLGSSLIVGLFIMPALSTYFIRGNSRLTEKNKLQQTLYDFAVNHYRPWIDTLLTRKKYRRRLTVSVIVLFLASLGLVGSGVIKSELFPQIDIDFFIVNIELPQGSTLKDTETVARRVETIVSRVDGLENFVTSIGRSAEFGIGGDNGASSEHLASVIVNLKNKKERKDKSYTITQNLRKELAAIEDARVDIEDIQGGPPVGEPIGIQVRGDELSTLSTIASNIKQQLTRIDGIVDITSSDKPSPPRFAFTLHHETLSSFNLSAPDVSQELRTALFGTDAATVTIDGDDIDIIVQYSENRVQTIEDIKNIEIINSRGERIKVSRIADVRLEPALQSVNHRDSERAVFISARNEGRSLPEIQKEVATVLNTIALPHGYRIIQVGEFEDQTAAFGDLYKAMSIAVLLIFFIMVVQFDSFKQPFVILLTLPLAFIGVMFGALIFGMPFGFPMFLGVVALGGIVVNDAIVLIDRINFNIRTRNMQMNDAIAEAGEARLQPILLTTTTTALGVVPLAFADEFWRGLSVAIAAGIIFATALTLFIIPLLYKKFEQPKTKKHE